MRIHICLFLGLALAVSACGSRSKGPPAWDPNGGGPQRDENYHGGPNAMLLKYDANHDGTLTRDELVTGLKADFAAYDTRKSQCLDEAQVAAINAQRIDADQSTATPLMDWKHNGCIDFQEFAATAVSLFDQLDKNGDGKVTPQEFGVHAATAPATGGGQGESSRRGRRGGTPPDGS